MRASDTDAWKRQLLYPSPPKGGRGVLLESLNRVRILDDLDGVLSELAAGNQLELSYLTEILAVELNGFAPNDVDLLDVIDGEILGGDCAFGGEAGAKGSHFSEGHAVAFEDKLLQTENCLGENCGDVAVVIDTAVVGDVLCELGQGEILANLSDAKCSGCVALLGFLRAGLLGFDGNTVINHNRPPPDLPEGRSFVFRGEDSGC